MFGYIRCKSRKDPDTIRNLPDPDIVSVSYNLILGFYNKFNVSRLYYPVQRRKDPDLKHSFPNTDIDFRFHIREKYLFSLIH